MKGLNADNMQCTDKSVFSNCNHRIKEDVVKELESCPNSKYAQHAGWDFCGYVWFDGVDWNEEVWVYNNPVETMTNSDLKELIKEVNAKYEDRL